MIEESKFCNNIMKKNFNKKLVMTKKKVEDLSENSTKCWICDNTYVAGDAKVTDHCHITGHYGDFQHRNCNISSVKSSSLTQFYKIPCKTKIFIPIISFFNYLFRLKKRYYGIESFGLSTLSCFLTISNTLIQS